MKISIWDVLTGIMALAGMGLVAFFAYIFFNPNSTLNPFPPSGNGITPLFPTATPTQRRLPQLWTATLSGSETPGEITGTPGTATPTPTGTATRTATTSPTVTRTRTITPTSGVTPINTLPITYNTSTKTYTPVVFTATYTLTPTNTGTPTNTMVPDRNPVGVGVYEDTDLHVAYTGAWPSWWGTGPSNGDIHYSDTAGNTVSLNFNTYTASQYISLVYTGAYNRGSVDIFIDNVYVQTLSEYDPTIVFQKQWNSGPISGVSDHNITLVQSSGGRIDVDAFIVSSSAPPPPTPTRTATPTPTGTFTPTVTATFLPAGLGKIDDTSTSIVYTGSWKTYNGAGPYLGTMHYSDVTGSKAVLTFNGQQVQITYTRDPQRGNMRVIITDPGGAVLYNAVFSQNGPTTLEWQQVSADLPPAALASGIYTLTLIHDTGTYVDLDAIEIKGVPTPTPTFTSTPTLTSTPTVTSTPTASGGGTYDDTYSGLVYSGTWYTWANGGLNNGTEHYSQDVGSSTSMTFNGTQVTLVYSGFTNRGIVDVSIDGGASIPVNEYDDTGTPYVFQKEATVPLVPLPAGVHTVTFTHASGSVISIDAVKITP